MKQYVVEVEDNTTLSVEDIKGALKVDEARVPIYNCNECKHLGLERDGLSSYAYCKKRREIIWGTEHWCTFGELREKKDD